jgi:hypothetical protein
MNKKDYTHPPNTYHELWQARIALYEEEFGRIPDGMTPAAIPGCEDWRCVTPDHQTLIPYAEDTFRHNGGRLTLADVLAIAAQKPANNACYTVDDAIEVACQYGLAFEVVLGIWNHGLQWIDDVQSKISKPRLQDGSDSA